MPICFIFADVWSYLSRYLGICWYLFEIHYYTCWYAWYLLVFVWNSWCLSVHVRISVRLLVLIVCEYILLFVTVDASLQKVYPEVYQKYTQKYTKSVARAPTMHSFDSYSSLCIHISCYLCVVAAYCLLCEICHYWLVSVNIHRHSYIICYYLLVVVDIC